MGRFLFIVLALTLVVTIRLLFLRVNAPKARAGAVKTPPVIEGRVTSSGPMELKSLEFEEFDAEAGPASYEEFFEKARITVVRTGTDWRASYALYVTTPKGLAAYLKKNKTDHQFGRDLLVVERYDRAVIRAAVLARIDDLPLLSEETS